LICDGRNYGSGVVVRLCLARLKRGPYGAALAVRGDASIGREGRAKPALPYKGHMGRTSLLKVG